MALAEWQASLMDQWGSGVFQKETPQATAEANAAAIGERTCLSRILNLNSKEINEILNLEDDDDAELDQANRAKTAAATGG